MFLPYMGMAAILNFKSGPILAILYREVPHMLPAKYQPNPPDGFMGMAAILNFGSKPFLLFFRSPSA